MSLYATIFDSTGNSFPDGVMVLILRYNREFSDRDILLGSLYINSFFDSLFVQMYKDSYTFELEEYYNPAFDILDIVNWCIDRYDRVILTEEDMYYYDLITTHIDEIEYILEPS